MIRINLAPASTTKSSSFTLPGFNLGLLFGGLALLLVLVLG